MSRQVATVERSPASTAVEGRQASFAWDLWAVAGRAVRLIPREPASVIPAILVPIFFFAVNLGSLEKVAEQGTGVDYKDFLLPLSIVLAVTGVSRAPTLVTDIQGGYFDRLCVTPIRRLALLLGLMVSDFVLVLMLSIPVLVLGFAVGVRFASGVAGVLVFLLLSALWGVAFTGFPYAIALKTGSPAAVSASFVLFFPFAFLTDAFVPKGALTGWLATIATYNPVTYLLGGLRSLVIVGWDASALLQGIGAVLGVAVVSMTLALLALRGRIRRGN